MSLTTTCTCWCEADVVVIPVEWIDEGRTAPCDLPSCEPGCPSRGIDAFDEPYTEEPTPEVVSDINRKRIMLHDYDPTADSSPGIPETVRAAYPGLVLHIPPGACNCGCEQPRSGKAKFRPGHDAKLKGKLQRAVAAEVEVHELGPDGSVQSTGAIEVARFYGWEKIVQKGADRIIARSQTPIAAEKRLYRLAEEGREGYTLLEKSRWEETGRLLTLWAKDETGEHEAMYVTPDGKIETVKTSELAREGEAS